MARFSLSRLTRCLTGSPVNTHRDAVQRPPYQDAQSLPLAVPAAIAQRPIADLDWYPHKTSNGQRAAMIKRCLPESWVEPRGSRPAWAEAVRKTLKQVPLIKPGRIAKSVQPPFALTQSIDSSEAPSRTIDTPPLSLISGEEVNKLTRQITSDEAFERLDDEAKRPVRVVGANDLIEQAIDMHYSLHGITGDDTMSSLPSDVARSRQSIDRGPSKAGDDLHLTPSIISSYEACLLEREVIDRIALEQWVDAAHPSENRAGALTAIQRTIDQHGTVLDLSGYGLREAPPALAGIKVLNLSHNALTQLPDWPDLRSIDASHNLITQLDTGTASLEYLDVSFNRLHTLPKHAFYLDYLNVSYNQISQLPQAMESLEDMQAAHPAVDSYRLPQVIKLRGNPLNWSSQLHLHGLAEELAAAKSEDLKVDFDRRVELSQDIGIDKPFVWYTPDVDSIEALGDLLTMNEEQEQEQEQERNSQMHYPGAPYRT